MCINEFAGAEHISVDAHSKNKSIERVEIAVSARLVQRNKKLQMEMRKTVVRENKHKKKKEKCIQPAWNMK